MPPYVLGGNHENLAPFGEEVLRRARYDAAFHQHGITSVRRRHGKGRHREVVPWMITDGPGLSGDRRRRRRLARRYRTGRSRQRCWWSPRTACKESSSEYAQGGIAVALSDDDEVGTARAGHADRRRRPVRPRRRAHAGGRRPGRHPATDRLGRGVRPRRARSWPSPAKARTAATASCTRTAIPPATRSPARSITRRLRCPTSNSAVTPLCTDLLLGRWRRRRGAVRRALGRRDPYSRARRAAGYRRPGQRVPQHHQPRCGHRRRRGAGLARRRGDRRHGIRPVPSHRAAPGGRAAFSAFRGPARRRRRAAERARRAVHGGHPSAEGTGAARRGGARHRLRDGAHRRGRTSSWI